MLEAESAAKQQPLEGTSDQAPQLQQSFGRVVTRNLVHKLNGANQEQPEAEQLGTAQGGADQNYQFYKEYCRLYYANIILTNRLQQLLNEKQELQFKLNRLEVREHRV